MIKPNRGFLHRLGKSEGALSSALSSALGWDFAQHFGFRRCSSPTSVLWGQQFTSPSSNQTRKGRKRDCFGLRVAGEEPHDKKCLRMVCDRFRGSIFGNSGCTSRCCRSSHPVVLNTFTNLLSSQMPSRAADSQHPIGTCIVSGFSTAFFSDLLLLINR